MKVSYFDLTEMQVVEGFWYVTEKISDKSKLSRDMKAIIVRMHLKSKKKTDLFLLTI